MLLTIPYLSIISPFSHFLLSLPKFSFFSIYSFNLFCMFPLLQPFSSSPFCLLCLSSFFIPFCLFLPILSIFLPCPHFTLLPFPSIPSSLLLFPLCSWYEFETLFCYKGKPILLTVGNPDLALVDNPILLKLQPQKILEPCSVKIC